MTMTVAHQDPAMAAGGRDARSDTRDADAVLPALVIASPGGVSGGGGMGTVTRAILEGFASGAAAPSAVRVVDPRGEGPLWRSPFHFVAAAFGIVRARLAGARLLHLQVSERGSFARKGVLLALGRALGMRVVLHHHGAQLVPFYRNAPRPLRALTRAICHAADCNIVLGTIWRDLLVDDMEIPAERVVILRNAAGDIRPAIRQRQEARGAADRGFHLVLLANLSPRKGVGELLEAVAALANQGRVPGLRLTLAGGGAVDRYRDEARRLGIGDLCTFTGWVGREAVLDLIAGASALVLPSHDEGLPMAIIEAAASEIPVVATPVGAIPEVLRHDRDALLVPPGDAGALAAALLRLAEEPGLRDRLAARAREGYEANFTIPVFVGQLAAIYRRVLASQSPGVANEFPQRKAAAAAQTWKTNS